MADVERRYTGVPVELRATGEQKSIGGYASIFNRYSANLGGFVEQVDPAAFNKSRGDGWPDVLARYNHDDNMLLGTTGGGTLRLSVDGTGLLYEVEPPASRSDVIELVSRGDVRRSSFAFRTMPEGDEWGLTDQGFPLRTLTNVQLIDVAPVNLPAYPDTTAGMRSDQVVAALRSLAVKMDAAIDEIKALAEANELRKLFVTTGAAPAKPKTFGPAAATALLARKKDPWA